MKRRIRVAALLLNELSEILLVQHVHPITNFEWWVPPGGGMESIDESIFSCAMRETFEETGLHIKCDGYIEYIGEFFDIENDQLNIELFVSAKVEGSKLTTSNIHGKGADEHYIKDANWFSREMMQGIVIFPEVLKNEFWDDMRDKGTKTTKYLGRQ